MKSESLKLIYFEGCPNATIAEANLNTAGIKYEKICQDRLDENHPYKKFASPTLLKGDRIVFGSATGIDGGCSLDLPAASEIKVRLKKMG